MKKTWKKKNPVTKSWEKKRPTAADVRLRAKQAEHNILALYLEKFLDKIDQEILQSCLEIDGVTIETPEHINFLQSSVLCEAAEEVLKWRGFATLIDRDTDAGRCYIWVDWLDREEPEDVSKNRMKARKLKKTKRGTTKETITGAGKDILTELRTGGLAGKRKV